MSRPQPLSDADARQRIVTDLTASLIVEAGAGSGKTHEMARRMAAGVAAGVYRVEDMAAVTFTRKAAAELRGRFLAALEQELAVLEPGAPVRTPASFAVQPDLFSGLEISAPDAVKVDRLREALGNVERLFTGTIHAFCARLLRERPIEAGVAPGFTELDDVEERMLRQSSWREFRAQARASGNPDLTLLNDAGIKAKELDKAFAAICNYEDVEFPAEDVPAPDVEGAWASLELFWRTLEAHLPPRIDPDTSCRTQRKVLQFQRAWAFAQRGPHTAPRLAELLGLWDFKEGITQNRWAIGAVEKKRINGIVPPLHGAFRSGTVTPWLDQWKRHLYAPAIRLLTSARERAQRDRHRRNQLSFNDLLMRTAAVLRENAAVRQALQDKYRWIFVDEFQDTDPLQAEIMFLLQGSTGALYVVGDPKQSIYRFRRADIDIYNQVRERIGGPRGADVVSLTTNFRSVPALCEWANHVFAARFPATADAYAPAFAPLKAYRDAPADAQALFVLTSSGPADEAEIVARYIRAEVSSGRRSYGDFLLLTRKKGTTTLRLLPYVHALEKERVPIEVAGAGAFGESEEVRELSRLLKALADPQDAVARTGVLRGPLFGLSDRALFDAREAVRNPFSADSNDAGQDGEVGQALRMLARWRRYSQVLPAGAALERILDESGYLALSATSPDGVDAGDLLHATDRVRAALEAGHSLAEAAEALQDVGQESSEIESWPLEPGRPDVVRLMNLHKAKGLEAPVVFLLDPDGGYSPSADIRIERKGSQAIGYLPITRKSDSYAKAQMVLAAPPDWDAHADEEQRYLVAEEERLLYVAATRAKDMLVVGRSGKGGKARQAWDGLNDSLAGVPELPIPAGVELPGPPVVDFSEASVVSETARRRHEWAREATWFSNAVTEVEKRDFPDPQRASTSSTSDPTSVLTASTPARRSDAGVAWGTLVHGLLEHAMRFPAATAEDLHRLAMWLTVEEQELRELIDQAVETVLAVARAEFWAAARASAEVHEEAPFAVRDRIGDVPGVLTGVIDLVYRVDRRWQIVDYKTDIRGGADELSTKYAGQMRAYEDAWARVAGAETSAQLVAARRPAR